MCVFCTCSQSKQGKIGPKSNQIYFYGIFLTQKGYKCYYPPSNFFFFVATDFTFNESESYFPTPYLQGENSIKEDKGQDSYLIDPFLIDLPKVSSLVFDSVSIP